MSDHKLIIGIDRFLSRRWVDYALDLRLSGLKQDEAYSQLQSWLSNEIKGKKSALKTASQIKRLWLLEDDRLADLRKEAVTIAMKGDLSIRLVLQYGMALNSSPFSATAA